ncbi:solute carrier family 15 member [Anaeramoeba flamelloides]|uniref:Solute carrier family 15 member n=1 Tax=Anaeramoeba flamelloides TaxID=1746091 RepID=A0AAV7Z233_9EUKA|nr:solute carrier family 15 member [Anaeramoeba flamelloides]
MKEQTEKSQLLSNDQEKNFSFPGRFYFILGTEFSERFCFYGMRALLVLFLISLGYSNKKATSYFHLFVFFCYFIPILGAFLADCWLGKFRTIFYFSLLYSVGMFLLSFSAKVTSKGLVFLSLFTIAFGSACIKPNVSAFLSDQVTNLTEKLLTRIYSLFYLSINVGSVLSTITTPLIQMNLNYWTAFGISAIIMFVSVIIFRTGKRLYIIVPSTGKLLKNFLNLMVLALKEKWKARKTQKWNKEHWLDWAKIDENHRLVENRQKKKKKNKKTKSDSGRTLESESESESKSKSKSESETGTDTDTETDSESESDGNFEEFDEDRNKSLDDLKIFIHAIQIFVPLPVFWALFDQHSSTWVIQADQMNLSLKFGSWKTNLSPSQIMVLNPALLMIMIPLFDRVIYPLLYRFKIRFAPLMRISVGLLWTVSSFVAAALVQVRIDKYGHGNVHWAWQIPQYALLCIGETLVSITGLQLAISESPKQTRSLMQSVWITTTGIGNLLVTVIEEMNFFEKERDQFLFFASLMLLFFFIFLFVAKKYTYSSVWRMKHCPTYYKKPKIEKPHQREIESAIESACESVFNSDSDFLDDLDDYKNKNKNKNKSSKILVLDKIILVESSEDEIMTKN